MDKKVSHHKSKKAKSSHKKKSPKPREPQVHRQKPEDQATITPDPPRPQFQVEEVAQEAINEEEMLSDPGATAPESSVSGTDELQSTDPGLAALSQDKSTMAQHQQNPTHLSQNPEATPPNDGSSNPASQHDFHFDRQPRRPFPYWVIAVVLVILLITGAIWKFVLSKDNSPEEETPSVTDILVETSTDSTPTLEEEIQKQEIERDEIKVQVLNGSGIKGAAGKLAAVLESAGFEDVDTGNSDDFDQSGIVIRVKDGENDLGDFIEADLEDDYQKIKVRDNLDDDSEYDAVITRGSQSGDDKQAADEKVLGASDEVSQPTDKTDNATDSASPQ